MDCSSIGGMDRLHRIGWNESLARQFESHLHDRRIPARVASVHGKYYRVWTADGELLAEVPGKVRHEAESAAELPAIGDWVALEVLPEDRGVIHEILPRSSRFSRKVAGEELEEQVIAANIDTLFVMQSLDHNFNLRRAERYLLTAWECGAAPVILLSKVDLSDDPEERVNEMQSVAIGVPVHTVSAKLNLGVEDLMQYLLPGKTVAFVGSSGVGKSTLINQLLGHDAQRVQEVREKDSKGKHTTSHRALFLLPSGCCVIDTPGMRELQLWSGAAGFEAAFPDIVELAQSCRFTDCRHETEPGCAVRTAVDSGTLNADRVASFLKLQRESQFQQARTDDKLRRERKQKERSAHRIYRKIPNRRT